MSLRLLLLFITMSNFNIVFAKDCKEMNLQTIIELAQSQTPEAKVALLQDKVAETTLEKAIQKSNPEFDLEHEVGDEFGEKIYATKASLKFNWELGGKRALRKDLAKSQTDVALTQSRSDLETKAIDLVLTYLKFTQLKQLEEKTEEAINAFKGIIRRYKNRPVRSPEEDVSLNTLELAENDFAMKLSRLAGERKKNEQHIKLNLGDVCELSNYSQTYVPINFKQKDISSNSSLEFPTQLKIALAENTSAQKNLELERSRRLPDLKLGPIIGSHFQGQDKFYTFGISLSTELPFFNMNGASINEAEALVKVSSIKLENSEKQARAELEEWRSRFERNLNTLSVSIKLEDAEKRHSKSESLFARGVLAIPVVIESHRQFVEYFDSYFQSEYDATEAYLNLHFFNGTLFKNPLF